LSAPPESAIRRNPNAPTPSVAGMPPDEEIVTPPVEPDIVIFVPAAILVTPVLVTVTPPVAALIAIPPPAPIDVTPLLVTVTAPVLALTPIPVPAASVRTPVLVIVGLPVALLTEIPAPATTVFSRAAVGCTVLSGNVTPALPIFVAIFIP